MSAAAFNHCSHMLTLLSANIQLFLSFSVMVKKKRRRREKTIPPCTFLLLLVKWNTYIRHHCGLHKCLKVINISSSVRLMCLVIGYLCCGLPLSKPPLHFGICVHVCVCVNGVAMCMCVRAFMHTTYVCVCVCMLAFVFSARNVPCLFACVCSLSSTAAAAFLKRRKPSSSEWNRSKRAIQSLCVFDMESHGGPPTGESQECVFVCKNETAPLFVHF